MIIVFILAVVFGLMGVGVFVLALGIVVGRSIKGDKKCHTSNKQIDKD